ncbi:hypothetical protein DV738_g2175, partial [Chaetothyriales sp. CBS 135597]
MAPSQVTIATSALQRLVKEEASYHKELDQQKARIAKLEHGETDDRENLQYQIKQEIVNALDKLETVLDQGETNEEERLKATEALKQAKEVIESAKA